MRKFVPGWIMELARRREVAAGAVLLLTGGLIWLAATDHEPAVQDNSLDAMRYGDLGTGTDAAAHASALGATQTARRMPPVDGRGESAASPPSMTAWMLSNAALDLNGEFVPPPIQVALTRGATTGNPPLRQPPASAPQERVIQQLQMEQDPSVPKARLTGVTLDGEQARR
jgi:hypothetical protein